MIFAIVGGSILYLAGGIVAALSTNGELNNWWILLALGLTAIGFMILWASLRPVIM